MIPLSLSKLKHQKLNLTVVHNNVLCVTVKMYVWGDGFQASQLFVYLKLWQEKKCQTKHGTSDYYSNEMSYLTWHFHRQHYPTIFAGLTCSWSDFLFLSNSSHFCLYFSLCFSLSNSWSFISSLLWPITGIRVSRHLSVMHINASPSTWFSVKCWVISYMCQILYWSTSSLRRLNKPFNSRVSVVSPSGIPGIILASYGLAFP